MTLSYLNQRVKNFCANKRFQKFSDDTSIHGFKELYYARRKFWLVFWFVTVSCAFGITMFQVYRAIFQYINQPTQTIVVSGSMEEILYPKMKACFLHWIYWLNWEKIYSLNFTKAALLYGMSFLSDTYSTEWFDVGQAKKSFEDQMEANGIQKLSEFYKLLAKNFPLADPSNLLMIDNSPFFSITEILYKNDWGTVMCYSTPDNIVNRTSLQLMDHIFSFAVQDQTYDLLRSFLTADEYGHYIAQSLIYSSNYIFGPNIFLETLSNISLPLLLYIDGYGTDNIIVSFENDWYKITVDVSAHRWKNTNQHPCDPSAKGSSKDNRKVEKCFAKNRMSTCTCPKLYDTMLTGNDNHKNLCTKRITFLDYNSPEPKSNFLVSLDTELRCKPSATFYNQLQDCLASVRSSCEVWRYTSIASCNIIDSRLRNLISKNITEIFIVIPIADEILVTIETDSQTWEDFIGNVGGLLGIWTGASVLSFVQLFYLCCYSENTESNNVTPILRPNSSEINLKAYYKKYFSKNTKKCKSISPGS